MSEMPDPYRLLLGIPPEEQPPSYYRILGIPDFEVDPSVIEGAADRQRLYLQTFQRTAYGAFAEKLQSEVAIARRCLLDPQRRAIYDQQLRMALAARAASYPNPQYRAAPYVAPQQAAMPMPQYPPAHSAPVVPIASGYAPSVPAAPMVGIPIATAVPTAAAPASPGATPPSPPSAETPAWEAAAASPAEDDLLTPPSWRAKFGRRSENNAFYLAAMIICGVLVAAALVGLVVSNPMQHGMFKGHKVVPVDTPDKSVKTKKTTPKKPDTGRGERREGTGARDFDSRDPRTGPAQPRPDGSPPPKAERRDPRTDFGLPPGKDDSPLPPLPPLPVESKPPATP